MVDYEGESCLAPVFSRKVSMIRNRCRSFGKELEAFQGLEEHALFLRLPYEVGIALAPW